MYQTSNEVIVIFIIGSALIMLLVIILVTGFFIQQKRKMNHHQQVKEINNQYERSLMESRLKTQADTFRRISQNLHDNIGSTISTAMLLLYKDEQISTEELDINRQEALRILGRSVDDLKNIARSLNTGYLENIGLPEAIRLRIEQLQQSKRYKIDFNCTQNPPQLSSQKQVLMFYMFQEAITNINKHAEATAIEVSLNYKKEKLIMRIKDNGKGMPEQQSLGAGLINMRSYASMINANLQIFSNLGIGAEIVLDVADPYTEVKNA